MDFIAEQTWRRQLIAQARADAEGDVVPEVPVRSAGTPKTMTKIVKPLIVAAIVALTACGASTASKPTLSEAFCSDVKSGMSPFQIYSGVKDQYTIKDFADRAYGFAAISCPAELKTNAGLRSFLVSWKINPDV